MQQGVNPLAVKKHSSVTKDYIKNNNQHFKEPEKQSRNVLSIEPSRKLDIGQLGNKISTGDKITSRKVESELDNIARPYAREGKFNERNPALDSSGKSIITGKASKKKNLEVVNAEKTQGDRLFETEINPKDISISSKIRDQRNHSDSPNPLFKNPEQLVENKLSHIGKAYKEEKPNSVLDSLSDDAKNTLNRTISMHAEKIKQADENKEKNRIIQGKTYFRKPKETGKFRGKQR